MNQKTVAVVTSTIGRPELIRAIESVKNQIYPCKHYIFVDGEQFHDKVREMVKDYPDVIVTYLPMNTGANGWMNSFINAASAYLIKEDIICYLDDDNWYENNHTQVIANAFNKYNIDMAFTLRNLVDNNGDFLCKDNTESIGFWNFEKGINYSIEYKNKLINATINFNRKNGHIDVNCLAFNTKIARDIANLWTIIGYGNDHQLVQALFNSNYSLMCTGIRTINYTLNLERYMDLTAIFKILDVFPEDETKVKLQVVRNVNNSVQGEMPWEKPVLFKNNQISNLEG